MGLSGKQLQLRSAKLVLHQFHNEALRSCEVVIAFGMPYETLLGAICYSVDNARAVGRFFAELCRIDEIAVHTYLSQFVDRLRTQLDFSSTDLPVKGEFKNTPMDFPRPSPTLLFIFPAFFGELSVVPRLQGIIDGLAVRMRSVK